MTPSRGADTGPLAGLLTIDLSRALAGPHAAMTLGDLGSRVIKVETPGRGDDSRGWGPPFVGPDRDQSTYFLSCNRNKESIALDLKSDDGREQLRLLLERADVVVENFRPGVMDRLGFSTRQLHELNPRLIVLSITGFGHDGPEAQRSGYDQIAQGEAGLMAITGSSADDPQRVGVPIADLLAGMNGALGVVAALHERDRTGRGTVVRTSLLASVVGVHAFQGTRVTVAGENPVAAGNHHPSIAPYGSFRCADGAVQISVGSESLWSRFCARFGIDPEAAETRTNGDRVRNRQHTIRVVEEAFATHRTADLLELLGEAGIPAGRIRSMTEVYEWNQVASQGLLVDVEHSVLGSIRLPGSPLRFFDTDTDTDIDTDTDTDEHETTRQGHTAPPTLDQHGSAVRQWLAEAGSVS